MQGAGLDGTRKQPSHITHKFSKIYLGNKWRVGLPKMSSIVRLITTMQCLIANRLWCAPRYFLSFQPINTVFCRYNIPQSCYSVVSLSQDVVLPTKHNTQLSASDMAYMAINYPHPSADRQSLQLQIALRTLKIPSEECRNWDNINSRVEFSKYVVQHKSKFIILFLTSTNYCNAFCSRAHNICLCLKFRWA